MSTRTTIKIVSNGELIATLYRHMDGYPAETGADLIETATKEKYASNTARALLAKTYDLASYETEPRHIYKISEMPGDIEHLYILRFWYEKETRIEHAERREWNEDLEYWTSNVRVYSLADFAAVVNKERENINKLIMKRDPNTKPEDLYKPIGA